jgi:hypothetical protein
VEKIGELHDHYADTPLAIYFRRPTIHAMVLFVSESTSIARQLGRGREIAEHNTKVADTGIGEPIELRATDLSEELVRRRYQHFDRDLAAEVRIRRAIDLAHATDADLLGDLVRAEAGSGDQAHPARILRRLPRDGARALFYSIKNASTGTTHAGSNCGAIDWPRRHSSTR